MRYMLATILAQKSLNIKYFFQQKQQHTAHISSSLPSRIPCECGSEMSLSRIYHHPENTSKLYICNHCRCGQRTAEVASRIRDERNNRILIAVVCVCAAYLTARAFIPFAIHLITGGQANV
jgi:hypothetical protein